MPRVNDEVLGKPTPSEVIHAMQVIRAYLKRGGWVQCIVDVGGGASFRLTDVHEDYLEALRELSEKDAVSLEWAKRLCTCGLGNNPSPQHRPDCPMRIWE